MDLPTRQCQGAHVKVGEALVAATTISGHAMAIEEPGSQLDREHVGLCFQRNDKDKRIDPAKF
jgi:hypothetical protein